MDTISNASDPAAQLKVVGQFVGRFLLELAADYCKRRGVETRFDLPWGVPSVPSNKALAPADMVPDRTSPLPTASIAPVAPWLSPWAGQVPVSVVPSALDRIDWTSIARDAPWPSVGWGLPFPVSTGSPASVVCPKPTLRRHLRNTRKNRARSAPPPPAEQRPARTVQALITECVRQIRAQHGIPDKESAKKLTRLFAASLRPRQYRGPDDETKKAIDMRLAGKEWSEIYPEAWADRKIQLQHKSREQDKLRRNTNLHLRKMMCKEGAPKDQSVTDWLNTRLKRQAGAPKF
jgi:hypothetical protein